ARAYACKLGSTAGCEAARSHTVHFSDTEHDRRRISPPRVEPARGCRVVAHGASRLSSREQDLRNTRLSESWLGCGHAHAGPTGPFCADRTCCFRCGERRLGTSWQYDGPPSGGAASNCTRVAHCRVAEPSSVASGR